MSRLYSHATCQPPPPHAPPPFPCRRLILVQRMKSKGEGRHDKGIAFTCLDIVHGGFQVEVDTVFLPEVDLFVPSASRRCAASASGTTTALPIVCHSTIRPPPLFAPPAPPLPHLPLPNPILDDRRAYNSSLPLIATASAITASASAAAAASSSSSSSSLGIGGTTAVRSALFSFLHSSVCHLVPKL